MRWWRERSIGLILPDPGLSLAILPGALVAAGAVAWGMRLKARARRAEAAAEALQDRVFELSDSAEHYRGLVEAQSDLVLRRTPQGRLTFVNEAYARLAGRPAAELIGSPFRLAGPAESAAGDQPVATPSGPRWYSWIEVPVRAPDGSPEIQAVGRDVTARREAEAALAEALGRAESASAAKSRFLAVVSHEIRTPLSAVLGMADLLAHTRIDPEQTTYVQALKSSGEALLSLIEEILDFAKIEAGRLELSEEPFDLPALVEGTVELLAPRAQGKGLDIACHVSRAVPRRVVGDAARVRQILMNLAGNAVKFTEAGGVGLRVEADGDDRIRVVVEDTGVGIPAERLDRVFEDFEQGAEAASERQGGTGLGLPISRRLAEGMGGSLTVTSEHGRGSRFVFAAPLPAAPGAGPAESGDRAGRGGRVLVASDAPFGADYLTRMLEDQGYEALRVGSVEAGLGALSQPGLRAMVADASLGDEGVRHLAGAARAAGIACRLLLMSPYQRRAFGPPATAGFTGYLTKPVRARVLPARLGDAAQSPAPTVPATDRLEHPAATGLRVLLAEDDEVNALLGMRLLERFGASVVLARDGLDAVRQVRAALDSNTAFDLVVLDLRMPGLDGCAAARRMRTDEAERGARPAPIMALTATAMEDERQAALAAGMDGILAKPVDPARLAELLARIQGLRRSA
jgi:signal transduction histidine kinase/CheY-like chemotaxis protein